MPTQIPKTGTAGAEVLATLDKLQQADIDWRGGRVFSLVYHAGEAHEHLMHEAYAKYASANLLNPTAFKGLKQLEAETVQMAARLLNGPETTVGCVTSGGTESILVAMHAYRERARKERPWIRSPEIVCARTVHPAFDKAAHYFGLKLRKVDIGDDLRADVRAMARKIGRNTIGLVVSAPQYPHGVIDPITDAAALAARHDLPLHVDACVGGFILPWLERLGRPLPLWDFRVPGVTSMSADIHKYGYAGKGASLLLWRSMDAMKYQFFVATDFPGGIYASPTMIGTRPGGPIAAAWAALVSLGEAGYLELARAAADASTKLREGLAAIPGVVVLGAPDAAIVAWSCAPGEPDVYAVAERLEARGWQVDRQHRPACVHLTCTANHGQIVERYLADVRASLDEVRANPKLASAGTAPMYGMMAKIPVRGLIGSSVRKVLEQMYAPGVVVPDLASAAQGEGFVDQLVGKYGPEINKALDKLGEVRDRLKKLLPGAGA